MARYTTETKGSSAGAWAVTAVLGQLFGIVGLAWLLASTGAVFKEPLDYACYQLETFPAAADEGTEVHAQWQWWPLGVRCSADLPGGRLVFREPALLDTAAPLLACVALLVVVPVAIYRAFRASAPGASRARCGAAAGLVLLAEPLGVFALLALIVAVAALAPVALMAAAVLGMGCAALLWISSRLVRPGKVNH